MSNWPAPHHGMVSEYQASGVPFVTSSASGEVSTTAIQITFPYVTRWIQVINTDTVSSHDLRFGFTQNGVNGVGGRNYVVLDGDTKTERLELKCTQLWFRRNALQDTSFSVMAGLTNVPVKQFFVLTGSNGVAGVG